MGIDREGPSENDLGFDPTKDSDYRPIEDAVWESVGEKIEGVGMTRDRLEHQQNAGLYAEAFFSGDWRQQARNRLTELGQPADNDEYMYTAAAGDLLHAIGADTERVSQDDRARLVEYLREQEPAADKKEAREQAAKALGWVGKYAGLGRLSISSRGEDPEERRNLRIYAEGGTPGPTLAEYGEELQRQLQEQRDRRDAA